MAAGLNLVRFQLYDRKMILRSIRYLNKTDIQEIVLLSFRLPAFFPHVAGVIVTVRVAKKYSEWTWALAGIGLVLEGLACFVIPFCTNYFVLMIPICVICFGIALIDTALLPLLGFIVDKKVRFNEFSLNE